MLALRLEASHLSNALQQVVVTRLEYFNTGELKQIIAAATNYNLYELELAVRRHATLNPKAPLAP
jgi:hypothetical protein